MTLKVFSILWFYDSSALSYAETEAKSDLFTYGQTGMIDLLMVKLETQTKSKIRLPAF